MAYTSTDFNKALKASGLSLGTSDLDMAARYPEYGMSLIQLNQDLGKAKTNEARLLATEAINQLRKNYGSYGVGESGNKTYATSYGSKTGDLIDNITSFDYDPDTDPIMAAYRKQFTREGERAAANALATSAAATGGRPSSYANTAAQQAANYYAAQLADKVPELREQAFAELLQQLGAVQSQDEIDYKRFLDEVNTDYQRDRDAVNDAQQEWNNAWQIFLKTGKVTGPLKGVITGTGATGNGNTGGGGGGGTGGGTGGTGGGTGGTGGGDTDNSANDDGGEAIASPKKDMVDYINYLKSQGYTEGSQMIQSLRKEVKNMTGGGSATAAAKKAGVSSSGGGKAKVNMIK